jgi:hypothetical protein
VDIDRSWRWRKVLSASPSVLKDSQSLLDRRVGRVEICRTDVRVDCVGDLVVARLVQTPKVEPHLGNVPVQSDRSRVRVERVSVLVDLEVEHTDRAPEGRVAAVSVHGLLIGFVGLVVPLTRHECSTEEVPALRIASV